jgi:hypothetical protein
MQELIKVAFKVIDDFRKPDRRHHAWVMRKLSTRRDLEVDMLENRYLSERDHRQVRKGRDVTEVFSPPGIDEMTSMSIRDAARKYLNKNRYVEVTLSPEKK